MSLSPVDGLDERRSERRATYENAPWDSARFIVPLLREAITAAIRDLPAVPGEAMKAIDLGCGSQPFRHHLENAGYSYIGVDAVQNGRDSVDFLAFLDRPLPPDLLAVGPVDVILCTEVLEHVADWHQAFRNIRCMLRPGGKVVITCPFIYPLHEQPHDYWRPTGSALRYFAACYGLKIIRQEQLGDFWDALGTVIGSLGLDGFARRANGGIALTRRNLGLLAVKLARRACLAVIPSGPVRKLLPLRSPFYISNLVIMGRQ